MNPSNRNSGILDGHDDNDNALLDSFKQAALKVTTLYKDSLVQNRKAYGSGYQQALQDLYEFISSHPNGTDGEHGMLPVQDLLQFARQRNAQLVNEMGDLAGPCAPTASSPHPSPSLSSTLPNDALPIQPTHSMSSPTASNHLPQPTTTSPCTPSPFQPFQMDPQAQFTLNVPGPFIPWQQSHNTFAMNPDNADSFSHDDPNIKRRMPFQDQLSFLGRPIHGPNNNMMHLDCEPPIKRRPRQG
ncbi:hypothetical protein DM01DRAFT_1338717 [Hesseltinella vesiculosa]|uniref:Uncharacterized protein n=1 Tax=Hesseltinella vesiculosa TaxID=101127 RepID=A0A1X2G981_9FUNG|nr:hypothetical protein DM01DRAFT_1338717 [Hesseltinella vesiculosa]